jgi:hypothetical protein
MCISRPSRRIERTYKNQRADNSKKGNDIGCFAHPALPSLSGRTWGEQEKASCNYY